MRAINKYRQTNVQTASPGEVLIMLYDGLLRFINEAISAMKNTERARVGVAIGKALAIVHELMSTLHHEQAPELCSSLYSLYEFIDHRLSQANMKRQPELLEEVIPLVEELRDAWSQAIHQTTTP